MEVELQRADDRFGAHIVLRSADGREFGTRDLGTTAPHCSALDDSLVLAIALMVDLSESELPHRASSPAPVEPVRPRRPTPIELPPRTHAPRQPWHLRAGVLASVAAGLLPGFAAGGVLSVGVEPPSFWLTELDVALWQERENAAGDEGARFSLVGLGLYLCPIGLGPQASRLAFCAGQELGRLRATGFGFDRNGDRTLLVYDLALRGRFSQRLAGPLRLLAGAGARFPLSRERFVAGSRMARSVRYSSGPLRRQPSSSGLGYIYPDSVGFRGRVGSFWRSGSIR